MKSVMIALVLSASAAFPAFAALKGETSKLNWQQCYDLGWDRGVHIEQNEMPHWLDECMTGSVPFSAVEAVSPRGVQQKPHQ